MLSLSRLSITSYKNKVKRKVTYSFH